MVLPNASLSWESLIDVLTSQSQLHPEKNAFIFLKEGSFAEETLTFLDLHQRAMHIALELRKEKLIICIWRLNGRSFTMGQ